MRSTLLFVAVLLACTPVHAQATAPPEAPILNAWLSALLPAPTSEAKQQTIVQRHASAPKPAFHALPEIDRSRRAEYLLPEKSATLLAHHSNAP